MDFSGTLIVYIMWMGSATCVFDDKVRWQLPYASREGKQSNHRKTVVFSVQESVVLFNVQCTREIYNKEINGITILEVR